MTASDPYGYYLAPPPSSSLPPAGATPPYWAPPPTYPAHQPPAQPLGRPSRRRRRMTTAAGVVMVAGALLLGGAAVGYPGATVVNGAGMAVGLPGPAPLPSGGGSTTSPSTGGRTTTALRSGVVIVTSVLAYQNAESAGTGMIISSTGDVLTNNHVVNGATSVTVTVAATKKSYRADVVGTAPSQDVAVLKLRNASGLTTAQLPASVPSVSVGDRVTALGNAGGAGTLTAAHGRVTALGRSITAASENGQDAERLTGLIQTDAPIISGDSGGPLYDSSGQVIGMNTAASANRQQAKEAYAIPIERALKVAGQIESGVQTATVHIGLPGFLGITSTPAAGGVAVAGIVPGGPAARAGITPGSVITAVDGKAVTTPQALRARLSAKNPGSTAVISWTDASGQAHRTQVTLAAGPAD